MTSAGTKVTTDPAATQNPISEAPGIITSDSLAAESHNQGGAFGAGSTKAAPSDQPSKGTTTSNEDTSDATVLNAAKDKAGRVDEVIEGESKGVDKTTERKGGSKGKEEQVEKGANEGKEETGEGQEKTTPSDITANDAPSYAQAVTSDLSDQQTTQSQNNPSTAQSTSTSTTSTDKNTTSDKSLPDDDATNASFTSTIGSDDDPAKLAEQKIQASNARNAASAGLPTQAGSGKIEDESQYKVLSETSS